MFKVEQNVPEVYVSESRDFQLFARLYDLVFQSSRQSIDSMQYVSDTSRCNERILPLLSTKLGFFSNLTISDKTLRHLLNAFPDIIRNKGSRKGFDLIANVFEKIANTKIFITDGNEESDLIIEFDTYNADLELLENLIDYVRPAGFKVSYITVSDVSYQSEFTSSDTVRVVSAPVRSYVSKSSSINYLPTIGHTQIVTKQIETGGSS